MRKSNYLVLSSFYFNFNDNLSKIIKINELFKKQNILDLFRFDKIKIIKKINYENNINFIYLPQSIEIIDDESFESNQIKILDLSNCINLKAIGYLSFWDNQIKQLKLPKNIEIIEYSAFENNQIESLDLSNYIKLKYIKYYAFSENPLTEIKILNNININYEPNVDWKYYGDVWNKFVKYYNDNGKKSGDYKYENDEWKWYLL